MAQEQEKDRDKKGVGKESPEDRERERAKEEAQTQAAATKEAQAQKKLAGALVEEGGESGKESRETSVESDENKQRLLKKLEGIMVLEEIEELEAKDELSNEDEDRLAQLRTKLKQKLLELIEKEGREEEESWKLDQVDEGTLAKLENAYSTSNLRKWIDKIGNLRIFFEDDCENIPSIEVGPGGNYDRDELKKLGTSWLLRTVEDDYGHDESTYSIIDNEKARKLLQTSIERRKHREKASEDQDREAKKLLDEME